MKVCVKFQVFENLYSPRKQKYMKKIEKFWKKKSFGFRKKKFGSDTDTFGWYRNRYRISVSHYFWVITHLRVLLESLKSSISHVQNIYNFIEFLQNLNMTTKSFLGPLWINRINHGVKKDIYFVFMNSHYLSLELQFLQSITLIAIFMISLHNTWFEQCF